MESIPPADTTGYGYASQMLLQAYRLRYLPQTLDIAYI
jgi:hypothetical protein